MTEEVVYLDSSALVKLAARERETGALRRFLHGKQTVASSALARTELVRALRHLGPVHLRRARKALGGLRLIRIDDVVLDSAASLEPGSFRTLDAIHLASAMSCIDELHAIVTYDERMRRAAVELGLPLAAPGL